MYGGGDRPEDMNYFIEIDKDFAEKLGKIKTENRYTYSDILFRIYLFNHEQSMIPADSEMFSAITGHTKSEIIDAIHYMDEHNILKIVTEREYFELVKEDFLQGKYKAPKAKTSKSQKRSKTGYTKIELKNVIEGQPTDLQDALWQFVEMRKAIKKPISASTLEKTIHKVENLAKDYLGFKKVPENNGEFVDIEKQIVEQSVDHAWQGVFELKRGQLSADKLEEIYG